MGRFGLVTPLSRHMATQSREAVLWPMAANAHMGRRMWLGFRKTRMELEVFANTKAMALFGFCFTAKHLRPRPLRDYP